MLTVTRLYDHPAAAAHAVQALDQAGIARDDISLVVNDADPGIVSDGVAVIDPNATQEDHKAAAGATLGTVVGGGAGVLTGLGLLAIPGLGPIVAAGWLVAALTGAGVGAGVGAAAGGLASLLMGVGVSDHDARVYAEGVRRGGALLTVRADEARVAMIEAVLDGRPMAVHRAAHDLAEPEPSHSSLPRPMPEPSRRKRVVSVSPVPGRGLPPSG